MCVVTAAVVVVFVLPGIDGGRDAVIEGKNFFYYFLGSPHRHRIRIIVAKNKKYLPAVPMGGITGAVAVTLVADTVLFCVAIDVTVPPRAEVGRPRGLGPTMVPGGAVTRGDFFLFLFVVCDSTSISSFGINATLVRNNFSNICAITTTSSPGLLYT